MEGVREKWKRLSELDRAVLVGGGAIVAGGALLSMLIRSWVPVSVATVTGATVIALHANRSTTTVPPEVARPPAPRAVTTAKTGDSVGSPMCDDLNEMREDIQQFNGLVSRSVAAEFPVPHRIPESAVYLDPMDDRIRSHVAGPKGPYRAGQAVNGVW